MESARVIEDKIFFFWLIHREGEIPHLNILRQTKLHKAGFTYTSAGTLEDNSKKYTGRIIAKNTRGVQRRIQKRGHLPKITAIEVCTCKKPNRKPEQPKANTLAHQQPYPYANLETPESTPEGLFATSMSAMD